MAIPRLHSLCSLLDGRVSRQGLELVTRCLRPGCCRGSNRISQVPGESQLSVCHVPNRLRQDCSHQTFKVQQHGPWLNKCKGSHDWVFRSSIAWLSDSLSTLRRGRYLLDARLASSCWSGSTARDSHPQDSYERFQSCKLHLIPLSQALLGAMFTTSAGNGS